MDSHDFIEVSDLARLLYTSYFRTAADRDRERENLEFSRSAGRPEFETQARHAYTAWSKVCDEYAGMLSKLADLVAKRLPKVYEDLRLVSQFVKWHNERDFDWTAAEKELRRIEAAALLAVGDQDDTIEWSKPVGYTDLRKALGVAHNTLKKRLVESIKPVVGKYRYKAPPNARLIQVVVSDLPADVQSRFRRTGKQASK